MMDERERIWGVSEFWALRWTWTLVLISGLPGPSVQTYFYAIFAAPCFACCCCLPKTQPNGDQLSHPPLTVLHSQYFGATNFIQNSSSRSG